MTNAFLHAVSAYDDYMDSTMQSASAASGKESYAFGGTAEYGDMDAELEGGNEEDDEDIGQEDLWDVISAFFAKNGLVQQQLASFNEFVNNTMQELVEEVHSLTLEQRDQHTEVAGDRSVSTESLGERREGVHAGARKGAQRPWVVSHETRHTGVRTACQERGSRQRTVLCAGVRWNVLRGLGKVGRSAGQGRLATGRGCLL